MVMPASEYELEAEYEGEEFLRGLAALARRGAASPALRRVAHQGARAALRGLSTPGGAPAGLGAALGNLLGGQSEFELEWEGEDESFANPLRRIHPDALMEHLAHAAAESESEAEAEAFIGALIPLAARLLPRAAPAIMRAAPNLVRAAAGVTRTLRRNPATRQLVRTLPTVVRRTAADLARQSAGGRPVPPAAAVRALARQTAQVVGNPGPAAAAMRRSRLLDQQYHRTVGATARPACRCGARPAPAAAPRRMPVRGRF